MGVYGNNYNYNNSTNQSGGKKSRKVKNEKKKYQTFEKQLLNLKKKVKNTIKGVKRLERLSNKNKKQNRKQNRKRGGFLRAGSVQNLQMSIAEKRRSCNK
jgi:septal ring factor EnvC (AmiA/AmiB activator)